MTESNRSSPPTASADAIARLRAIRCDGQDPGRWLASQLAVMATVGILSDLGS
jgi:hypothetical protein